MESHLAAVASTKRTRDVLTTRASIAKTTKSKHIVIANLIATYAATMGEQRTTASIAVPIAEEKVVVIAMERNRVRLVLRRSAAKMLVDRMAILNRIGTDDSASLQTMAQKPAHNSCATLLSISSFCESRNAMALVDHRFNKNINHTWLSFFGTNSFALTLITHDSKISSYKPTQLYSLGLNYGEIKTRHGSSLDSFNDFNLRGRCILRRFIRVRR